MVRTVGGQVTDVSRVYADVWLEVTAEAQGTCGVYKTAALLEDGVVRKRCGGAVEHLLYRRHVVKTTFVYGVGRMGRQHQCDYARDDRISHTRSRERFTGVRRLMRCRYDCDGGGEQVRLNPSIPPVRDFPRRHAPRREGRHFIVSHPAPNTNYIIHVCRVSYGAPGWSVIANGGYNNNTAR